MVYTGNSPVQPQSGISLYILLWQPRHCPVQSASQQYYHRLQMVDTGSYPVQPKYSTDKDTGSWPVKPKYSTGGHWLLPGTTTVFYQCLQRDFNNVNRPTITIPQDGEYNRPEGGPEWGPEGGPQGVPLVINTWHADSQWGSPGPLMTSEHKHVPMR